MIAVKLMGGLGNQMFQYAIGRSLSLKYDVPLYLDLGWFQSIRAEDTFREYDLSIFPIGPILLSTSQASLVQRLRRVPYLGFLHRLSPEGVPTVSESGAGYDASISARHPPFILDGYWQSEHYFRENSATIRKDFAFPDVSDKQNELIVEKILHSKAVSLHVRRGDYASNPSTAAFHGICGVDYYRRAIIEIREHVADPTFFLFSDEPALAKQELSLGEDVVSVDWNVGKESYRDMQLMALCQHHIIANSSFSWWGAWLGTNPQKMVVAPRQWFRNVTVDELDIIPSDWITL